MIEPRTFSLLQLPDDAFELASVPPDGASADGLIPTPGLPLETAMLPDVEPGVDAAQRWQLEPQVMVLGQTEHISEDGLGLIESFEGFSAVRYLDAVGVPTIGYGTTSADIFPLPATCTRAQAEGWLRSKLASKYEPAVRSLRVPLNQHQFDALCSFVYNLGPGSMSSAWTIGRLLRARQYTAAANALLMYDRAGGMVLPGLVRRRQAERALFLTPMPVADPHNLSRFPDAAWILGGRQIADRATMAEWYRLRPDTHGNAARLRQLQADIVLLRKRDWAVAHWDHPPSWASNWRGWRWQRYEAATAVDVH